MDALVIAQVFFLTQDKDAIPYDNMEFEQEFKPDGIWTRKV